MPKRPTKETPRGNGALAAAPALLMRAIRYSPKDFAAGTIAVGAICAIVGNAIFMQAGRHPSPLFGTPSFSSAAAPMIANPLPRPRPLEAVQPAERSLDSRLFDGKPVETKAQPKPEAKSEPRVEVRAEPRQDVRAATPAADPMANLIRNASVTRATPNPSASNAAVPRPPAPVPTSSRGDPLGDFISCSNTHRCGSR